MIDETERTADENIRASQIEQMSTEEAIRKVLRKKEAAPSDFNGIHCYDCSEEIPKPRLVTGAFRCIHCQTKAEHFRKNHRSNYE